MVSTKEEVYSYLEQISRDFVIQDLKRFTANDISETLNISRNLASQYLNELVKEKRAIKVNSRPVYFFHKHNVELSIQVLFDTCVFSGLDEFILKAASQNSCKDFQKAIGHYLSLSSCVEQCKAAVHYPPNGLPVLFWGAPGTGKSFLSRLMFEYGKNQRVLGPDARYIAVDCGEYAQDQRKFLQNLCGTSAQKGWLSEADKGMLFLDDIDRIPVESQEAILSYLSSGQYRIADTGEMKRSEVRLVFSASRPPEEALFKGLARRIPIVIPIPSLSERTVEEKEEMLVSFLRQEGRRMGVEVSVSRQAFSCLMEYPFENNIDELKACITSCCANAYMEKGPEGLQIQTYHLPDYILSGLKLDMDVKDESLIRISAYNRDSSLEQAVSFFQMILDEYQDFQGGTQNLEAMIQAIELHIKDYYDYLIYSQKLTNTRIATYEHLINQIFQSVGETYGFFMPKKHSYLLARCLYIQQRGEHILSRWTKENQEAAGGLLGVISQSLPRESVIMRRITGLIRRNLDIETDTINQLLLLLGIKSQSQSIPMNMTAGIILSHGYSTASSIADAANQIIGKKVFEAIDMPLDEKSQDIAAVLEKYIERYIASRDILLMVDMGSLEQINQELKCLSDINIGIINNISTALAVDIGSGITSGQDTEDILCQASQNNVCTYRIIRNVRKEDAILFCGENGLDMADRIKDMIQKSFEGPILVQFISCDYYRLARNGRQESVFGTCQVKCIIGLVNPEIEGIPFIALEDMISMNAADQIRQIFSEYMDNCQLESFIQNLLKNFTLQNVVESITILNPAKLLDEVEQLVEGLQQITGQRIDQRVITGLYVHLCCAVERLVTKTAIENYPDLESFQKEHSEFIGQVKECFLDIASHYKVELPVSEIAYLYDYIHLHSKNKTLTRDLPQSTWEDE